MSEIIDIALHYKRDLGLNVLPVIVTWNPDKNKYDKKPAVPWVDLQSRMVTDEEITEWWTKYPNAGIGAVMGSISGVIAIDCDSQASVAEMEESLRDDVAVPCSKTISGTRHYFLGAKEKIGKKVRFYSDMDLQAENSLITLPPTHGRNGDKYEWITEPTKKEDFTNYTYVFNDITQPANALKSVSNNIRKYIINKESTIYLREPPPISCNESVMKDNNIHNKPYKHYRILEKGHRDEDLFRVANALVKTNCDEDFARQVLEILAKSANPPYPVNEIDIKIKSALDRKTRRTRNVVGEIREYLAVQGSLQETNISITACLQSLQILQEDDKKAAYTAFSRLCTVDKILEKLPLKRGEYRIINRELENSKMDLLTEEVVSEVPVKLPMGLNELCVISKGNIIMVSGSKSAGKTAFVMNIAKDNQDSFEVVYLNSEMHQSEFKKRMLKFAPLNEWKITGHKCHKNFADFIDGSPGKLYIIDYLEIHDNFYEIAKPIREIHEKLGDSIAFIALQMKGGASLGRGGDFSAEKARLYLTMDYNEQERRSKVTIYDAKEPRPPFNNVRGKFRSVTIREGNQLIPYGEWAW
jgi:hypothetical protein